MKPSKLLPLAGIVSAIALLGGGISYAAADNESNSSGGCDDATGFNDISLDSRFCEDIMWLKENGITKGYDDGTFRPKNRISREAMAAFMHRYADKNASYDSYETFSRTSDETLVKADETKDITSTCGGDLGDKWPEKAIGGGAHPKANKGEITINASHPSDLQKVSEEQEGRWGAESWTVTVTNHSDDDVTVQPYLVCADLDLNEPKDPEGGW